MLSFGLLDLHKIIIQQKDELWNVSYNKQNSGILFFIILWKKKLNP